MSFFEGIEQRPVDPVLSLPIDFAADPRSKKVNLGIGTYRDSEGKPFVLPVVRSVEASLFEKKVDKEYLPIEGSKIFLQETTKLIFGKEQDVFAAQAVGGTSALHLGGQFLAEKGERNIYISNPSWPNHSLIFKNTGLKVNFYPYFDEKSKKIDFSAMCEAIKQMPADSVIILQAACHNPTGTDLSQSQWKELSTLIKTQKVLPFFDLAYQGFGGDLDTDAYAIRYFAEQGHEMLIAYSYSKIMGLYGERVGALIVVAKDKDLTSKIGSHLKQIIRSNYSTPPIHGASIVAAVLESEKSKKDWIADLTNMRGRVTEMREAFVAGLELKCRGCDFSYVQYQKGLFSYLGLNQEQVQRLRQEFAIYIPSSGRINIGGLNWLNMDYVIDAIISTMKK